jgi:hypothetical protein
MARNRAIADSVNLVTLPKVQHIRSMIKCASIRLHSGEYEGCRTHLLGVLTIYHWGKSHLAAATWSLTWRMAGKTCPHMSHGGMNIEHLTQSPNCRFILHTCSIHVAYGVFDFWGVYCSATFCHVLPRSATFCPSKSIDDWTKGELQKKNWFDPHEFG